MDYLEQWTTRAKELSEVSELPSTAAILAWATNVLTLAEAVCGTGDAKAQMLQRLINDAAQKDRLSYSPFVEAIRGFAQGLYNDLSGGYFIDLRLAIRADVEGDLLRQAQRLLEERMKDPAAMLIGAVLEDALRQLCRKPGVPEGNSSEAMNEPLRAHGIYGLPQKQLVTAWAAIRNKADHARFGEYSEIEVRAMHQGVSGFVAQHLS